MAVRSQQGLEDKPPQSSQVLIGSGETPERLRELENITSSTEKIS
jgi:hypothetical protein